VPAFHAAVVRRRGGGQKHGALSMAIRTDPLLVNNIDQDLSLANQWLEWWWAGYCFPRVPVRCLRRPDTRTARPMRFEGSPHPTSAVWDTWRP